jgi:hypothetical protein
MPYSVAAVAPSGAPGGRGIWAHALQRRINMICMKPAFILALLFGLFLGGPSFGQEFTKATLHVASVRSGEAKDWCETGECSATRHTVEGYITSKDDPISVEYVLECVEVLAHKPSPHYTGVCDKVHAHEEYVVKVFPNAIAFEHEKESSGTKESSGATPVNLAYHIVSEKEVAKQKTK